MQKRDALVLTYIALNLGISIAVVDRLPPGVLRFFLGMWMPALTGALFLALERQPIREGLAMRVGRAPAYLAAVLVPVFVGAVTAAIGHGTGYLVLDPAFHLTAGNAIPTLILWALASLGEELGWRGYLHGRLRAHRHAPALIGVVWAAWHYRQLLTELGPLYTFAIFTPLVVLTSYVLSLIVEVGGSVWPCALYHGVWNFMRMKVLFGNPQANVHGLFTTSNSMITEMEGAFGFVPLVVVSVLAIRQWYRRFP